MSEDYYDIAQVCMNGHVTNSRAMSDPQRSQDYCDKCGKETITECPQCGMNIKGYHHCNVVFLGSEPDPPPSFCHACGKPFPWTEANLKAAKELAETLDELTRAEREALASSFDDIATNNPQTKVAAARIKTILKGAGVETAKAVGRFCEKLAVEAAKEILFPK